MYMVMVYRLLMCGQVSLILCMQAGTITTFGISFSHMVDHTFSINVARYEERGRVTQKNFVNTTS